MAVSPQLLMAAGIAVAGLGLIGAGAGATFTAQVAGSTSVTTGDIGLSLNGRTGPDLHLDVDGSNLGPHFAPITQDLRVENTGTLDITSTRLDLTATGCDGGPTAALARSLRVTVTDLAHSREVYDGALCSAGDLTASGGAHPQVGSAIGTKPAVALRPGRSTLYRLVLQPSDAEQGLSPAALDSHTSVRVVFTGSDS